MRAIHWTAIVVSLGAIFAPAAVAGKSGDTINAFSEPRKADFFRQLISADGNQCGSVSKVLFKGEVLKEGSDVFAVRCEPGDDWFVQVKNGGNMKTHMVPCDVMKTMGFECWN
jgi:hypothetical protein